jgi:Transposase DDE domain
MLLVVRRWYPKRQIVAVADGGHASLKLLDRCRKLKNPITFITRLRLDAALYEPAAPRKLGQMGRPRLKGSRLPNLSAVGEDPKTAWTPITVSDWYGGTQRVVEIVSDSAIWYSTGLPAVPVRWVLIRDPQEEEKKFDTQALLCTDLDADPVRIISWFVRRWQMETTFQEVRQRLGFETQRQWSERAIQNKSRPTFSDALALVRRQLWAQEETFCGSGQENDMVKVPREFVERLTEAVCYAA